mmetsp:Transcript_2093/g.9177  ORF Transcript_2093/g.9177 Transcript_2093/m.9177 type:complete len:233 (-) Transcript_2093:655-1353(-)
MVAGVFPLANEVVLLAGLRLLSDCSAVLLDASQQRVIGYPQPDVVQKNVAGVDAHDGLHADLPIRVRSPDAAKNVRQHAGDRLLLHPGVAWLARVPNRYQMRACVRVGLASLQHEAGNSHVARGRVHVDARSTRWRNQRGHADAKDDLPAPLDFKRRREPVDARQEQDREAAGNRLLQKVGIHLWLDDRGAHNARRELLAVIRRRVWRPTSNRAPLNGWHDYLKRRPCAFAD